MLFSCAVTAGAGIAARVRRPRREAGSQQWGGVSGGERGIRGEGVASAAGGAVSAAGLGIRGEGAACIQRHYVYRSP